MFKINERSTAYVQNSCYNAQDQLEAPVSMVYRIDCLTTGEVIRADTVLASSAQVSVTLTPEDTRIINYHNMQERRRITFIAGYGANDGLNDTIDFIVKNLRAVS